MRHVLGGLVFKKGEAFYLRVPLDHDTDLSHYTHRHGQPSSDRLSEPQPDPCGFTIHSAAGALSAERGLAPRGETQTRLTCTLKRKFAVCT